VREVVYRLKLEFPEEFDDDDGFFEMEHPYFIGGVRNRRVSKVPSVVR